MSEIDYWTTYYEHKECTSNQEPSKFARFVKSMLKNKINTIIEVGSGSGRDAYFLGRFYNVRAIDLACKPKDTPSVTFHQGSMTDITGIYDLLYSRFSLHSVSEDVEDFVLDFAKKNCSYIAIEARSTNDTLSNDQTVNQAATSYAAAHYRRYMNLNFMVEKLSSRGFEILYAEESNLFAPYKDDNPVCVRIIAKT